jgi:hypothetical protein
MAQETWTFFAVTRVLERDVVGRAFSLAPTFLPFPV